MLKIEEKKDIFRVLCIVFVYIVIMGLYNVFKEILDNERIFADSDLNDFVSYIFLLIAELVLFIPLFKKCIQNKNWKGDRYRISFAEMLSLLLIQILVGTIGVTVGNCFCLIIGTKTNVTAISLSLYICLKLFIIAPILEEMLFRYIFINYIDCIETNKRILLSAVIFAIAHIYSQGVVQVFYTFALGIVWGIVFVKYRKIILTMIMHSFSNIWMILVPYILKEVLNISTEVITIIMFSVIPLIGLVVLNKKTDLLTVKTDIQY